MRRAARASDRTTRAASSASSTPSSSRGAGALSANTPAYRWCWCRTSAHGISSTPVRRAHLSSAASRIRSCRASERRNAAVGEFCRSRITSFTSSVRAARRSGCTSSTVRLFVCVYFPLVVARECDVIRFYGRTGRRRARVERLQRCLTLSSLRT